MVGRYTLMVSFMVIFLLQVGHLPWAAIEALMQPLQKIWPHFVDISSTSGPMHTGQLNVGSFGFGGTTLCAVTVWHQWQRITQIMNKWNSLKMTPIIRLTMRCGEKTDSNRTKTWDKTFLMMDWDCNQGPSCYKMNTFKRPTAYTWNKQLRNNAIS